MSKPVQLSIQSIQHVGIPVSDRMISESFYARLGFANVMQAEFAEKQGKGTCVMMKKGDIIIELYELPAVQLEAIRNRRDGHIDHIAFDVPDIEHAFSVLKKEGFAIVEEAPVFLNFWQNGCRYFNVIGPDGERLEFNQIL